MRKIKEIIPEEKEENLIIGGDFNSRMGTEGTIIWSDDTDEIGRKSKDKIINREGREFREEIEEREWDILNGNTEGDEEGEVTYIGARGSSVIDYAITNVEIGGKINRMVIED